MYVNIVYISSMYNEILMMNRLFELDLNMYVLIQHLFRNHRLNLFVYDQEFLDYLIDD